MQIIQALLISIGIVLLYLSLHPITLYSPYLKYRGDDDLWVILCILMGGIILWISLCRYMIHEPTFLPQYFSLQMNPLIFIGLLWPVIFGIFQTLDFYYDREENLEHVTYYRTQISKGVKDESSAVTGLVFAMGALLIFVGGSDRQQVMPAVRFFLIVIIICLGLIGTTHYLANNNHNRWTLIWKSSQRLCVNIVIGLLLTALLMIFVVSSDSKYIESTSNNNVSTSSIMNDLDIPDPPMNMTSSDTNVIDTDVK